MSTLLIRHSAEGEMDYFQLSRSPDGKAVKERSVVISPIHFPVEAGADANLMGELRWYLESFLDYPFPPKTDHANLVLAALRTWGEQAFKALFNNEVGGILYHEATRNGDDKFHLQVISDDPRVLGWPWEAVRDPRGSVLAQTCQVERQLDEVRDPYELSEKLPRDRINILMVTARPYEADVRYRTLSRPLVDLIER